MAGRGRPTLYTQELADKICAEIAIGKSVRTVLLGEDMPAMTSLFKWLRENEDFTQQYARACEERAEFMLEEMIDTSEEGIEQSKSVGEKRAGAVVQAYKNKTENMKWYMSKVKAKKYGDKLDVTTDGKQIPMPIMPLKPKDEPAE